MVRIAHGEAGWLLVDRDGNEHAADLVAHVDRGIMQALEFRVGGRAHRFVLLADNCDRETARRLRLVLAKHMPGDDDIR